MILPQFKPTSNPKSLTLALIQKDLPPPIRPQIKPLKPLNARQRAFSEISHELQFSNSVTEKFYFNPVGEDGIGLGSPTRTRSDASAGPETAEASAPPLEEGNGFEEPGLEWY